MCFAMEYITARKLSGICYLKVWFCTNILGNDLLYIYLSYHLLTKSS